MKLRQNGKYANSMGTLGTPIFSGDPADWLRPQVMPYTGLGYLAASAGVGLAGWWFWQLPLTRGVNVALQVSDFSVKVVNCCLKESKCS